MTFRWWVEEELTIDGTQYVVLQLRYIPPHIKLSIAPTQVDSTPHSYYRWSYYNPRFFLVAYVYVLIATEVFNVVKFPSEESDVRWWFDIQLLFIWCLVWGSVGSDPRQGVQWEKERDSASELPWQCQRLAEWGNVAWPWWQTHSRLPAPTSTPGPGVAELSRGEPGHLLSDRLQPGHRWAIFGSPVLFWTPRPQSARIF